MQFIANGPDIPNELLFAQSEGKLVFFCGAGISYPAGLPGFKELVEDIYIKIGTSFNESEKEAFEQNQYEFVLNSLENRIVGEKIAMRKELINILQPKLRRKGAKDIHKALLTLSRDNEKKTRLVTTNFDRIFEKVIKSSKRSIKGYAAPMLPIPKKTRWNGIIYLHGLLPEKNNEEELNQIVLTSGDFGLAYLTERWASRFVSELFRNYIVCFVGYSLNDPILRYLVDALAADKRQGEEKLPTYALVGCETGQEKSTVTKWKSKIENPILYEVPKGKNDHSILSKTLVEWSETYSDGIWDNKSIVTKHASTLPVKSTKQDDFKGRMLWAISDPSGIPAKHFANFNPVPSLEWLKVFSENIYDKKDLIRFGILPNEKKYDSNLYFSLIHRPTPYHLSKNMSMFTNSFNNDKWDEVMQQLAKWLTRHLNNLELIFWFCQRGGQLHPKILEIIGAELERFAYLTKNNNMQVLDKIREQSPDAIPNLLMQKLWNLFLAGHVNAKQDDMKLYDWQNQLEYFGMSISLRLNLRQLLAPAIVLNKKFHIDEKDKEINEPKYMSQFVSWDIILSSGDVANLPHELAKMECWKKVSPDFLNDFQQLLHDALDLLQEISGYPDADDISIIRLPSISSHSQNRAQGWVVLIELLRDAWLNTLENDSIRARKVALEWFSLPYQTFKKLALFAASHDDCISGDIWVDWLLSCEAKCLWSSFTRRETLRLLVKQGQNLSSNAKEKLEKAILSGPNYLINDDHDENIKLQRKDYFIWLYLMKLQSGGNPLSHTIAQHLEKLSLKYPEWKLSKNQREEFSYWMTSWTSGTDADVEYGIQIIVAPTKRKDLVCWLEEHETSQSPFEKDNWPDVCQTHMNNCFNALCDLAEKGNWQKERWSKALHIWSRAEYKIKSAQLILPKIIKLPDVFIKNIIHPLTYWMQEALNSKTGKEKNILKLCCRLLNLEYEVSTSEGNSFNTAANNPVGHIAQMLLNLWFERKPNDDDSLPRDIEPLFTKICDVKKEKFYHGRALLASRLVPLFRVDKEWTEHNMLPLFNWDADKLEATGVWQGFLYYAQLYIPLFLSLKKHFLSTASHYDYLEDFARSQFIRLLTYSALEPMEGYTKDDYRSAFKALPKKCFNEVADILVQFLESTGERREECWDNRISPFWKDYFPKDKDFCSDILAETLARLSIAAGNKFPEAFSCVKDWLQPIQHCNHIIYIINETKIAQNFPEEILSLLDKIFEEDSYCNIDELQKILKNICDVDPSLSEKTEYKRLKSYIEQRRI